jgi:hypothetical protein
MQRLMEKCLECKLANPVCKFLLRT